MKFKVTKETFLEDVKQHVMTVLKDDGIYRQVRFKKSTGSEFYFDLITFPHHLVYTGDMGTYVFSRIEDMFEFFRSGTAELSPNFGYWAEKCLSESIFGDGIREFSIEEFEEQVIEEAREHLEKEEGEELTEDEKFELFDLLHCNDEYEAVEAIRQHCSIDIPMDDFSWNHCKVFTNHFTWCCYAIQWGIMQYDKEAHYMTEFTVEWELPSLKDFKKYAEENGKECSSANYVLWLDLQYLILRFHTSWHTGVPEEGGKYLGDFDGYVCICEFSNSSRHEWTYASVDDFDSNSVAHDAPIRWAHLPREGE